MEIATAKNESLGIQEKILKRRRGFERGEKAFKHILEKPGIPVVRF